MKLRIWIGFTAMLAMVGGAHAATLTLSSDQAVYIPGETIHLTVVGDAEGAKTNGIFGEIVFDPTALIGADAIVFAPQSNEGFWNSAGGGCPSPGGVDGECWLMNAIAFPDELGFDPETQVLATVTGIAGAVGIHSIEWRGPEKPGNRLTFFGLTSAPGLTFQIVPEPGSFGLLALGLALTSGAARRRSLGGSRRARAGSHRRRR